MNTMKSVYRVKILAIGAALSLLAVSQVSCLQDSGPGGCNQPFELVITPEEIRGSSHIYIAPEKLDALNDPKVVVKDAYLEVTLRGRNHRSRELTLSLNGIKISRRDGGPHCDELRGEAGADISKSKFPLHKMFLNGALPFHLFIAKLKDNRGLLKLTLHGPNVHVLDARMVVRGTKPGLQGDNCNPGGGDVPVEKPSVVRIVSTSPSDSLTSSTGIQIAYAADRAGETFYCSLDGRTAEICQSPSLFSSLANGLHTFSVYARSPKGLKSNTAEYQWTVDSHPPTATITNSAALPALTNTDSISFEFTASESGRLVCSLDDAAFEDCVSPLHLSGLAEGTHSFRVNVIDLAGNIGEQPARFNWNIDRTPPNVSLVSVEPAEIISRTSHKTFLFAASESAATECSVDNGAFVPCTSPFALDNVVEGRHWFEVRATDLAGNHGPSTTYAWNVDLTVPVITVTAANPQPGRSGARSINVAFATSEEAEVTCRFDGEEVIPCISPFLRGDLTEGRHTLALSARDVAGNESPTEELAWTLDFTSPQIGFAAIDPVGAYIRVSSLRADVDVSENSVLHIAVNGTSISQNSSPILLTDLPEGSYELSVQAEDSVGNRSNRIAHVFTVDLTAPFIAALAPDDTRSPANKDSRSFTFAANEVGATFQCQLDEAGFEACVSPLNAAGLADGAHVFNVRAVDFAGNVGPQVSYSWVIDTRAPLASIMAVQHDNSIQFTLTADETPVTYECSLDDAAFSACVSPIRFESLDAGFHTFVARATDEAGNTAAGGAAYGFEVLVPIKTTITHVSPGGSLINQRSLSVEFSSNRANATFLCSLDGAEPAPCTSPLSIDDLADGHHTLNVRAVDSNGAVDIVGATHSWSVDATAPGVPGLSLSVTTTSITVTWTTDESATGQILWGTGTHLDQITAEDPVLTTSHQIRLTGLSANTVYSVQVTGRDAAGNVYTSSPRQIRTSR